MENITIKKASSSDLSIIQYIGQKTFIETFAAFNTQKDLDDYLKNSFNEVKLTHELSNLDSFFYLLFVGHNPAGYLKLNILNAQTEKNHNNALEIERIYILKEYQGKQLGQMLLNKATQVAKDLEKEYIWLGVWEKNEKALKFYSKNKFVQFDKHIFKLGDDEQTDFLYKLTLK